MHDHVEIEGIDTALVLRGIDHADGDVDADLLQRLRIILNHALERRLRKQDLDVEFFACCIDERAVLLRPAGLLQQPGAARR